MRIWSRVLILLHPLSGVHKRCTSVDSCCSGDRRRCRCQCLWPYRRVASQRSIGRSLMSPEPFFSVSHSVSRAYPVIPNYGKSTNYIWVFGVFPARTILCAFCFLRYFFWFVTTNFPKQKNRRCLEKVREFDFDEQLGTLVVKSVHMNSQQSNRTVHVQQLLINTRPFATVKKKARSKRPPAGSTVGARGAVLVAAAVRPWQRRCRSSSRPREKNPVVGSQRIDSKSIKRARREKSTMQRRQWRRGWTNRQSADARTADWCADVTERAAPCLLLATKM